MLLCKACLWLWFLCCFVFSGYRPLPCSTAGSSEWSSMQFLLTRAVHHPPSVSIPFWSIIHRTRSASFWSQKEGKNQKTMQMKWKQREKHWYDNIKTIHSKRKVSHAKLKALVRKGRECSFQDNPFAIPVTTPKGAQGGADRQISTSVWFWCNYGRKRLPPCWIPCSWELLQPVSLTDKPTSRLSPVLTEMRRSNTETLDVHWRSRQSWSKSPFTTNLLFFSWLLLININLILKPEASIMGLASATADNNRNCFPSRSTDSSPRWFCRGRRAVLQGDATRFMGWK